MNPYTGLAPIITPEQRRISDQLLVDRHAETMRRLRAQTEANAELRREMRAALEWCRANGNPHRKDPTP